MEDVETQHGSQGVAEMIEIPNVVHRLREAGVEIAIELQDNYERGMMTDEQFQLGKQFNWVDHDRVIAVLTDADPNGRLRKATDFDEPYGVDFFKYCRAREQALQKSYVFSVAIRFEEIGFFIKPLENGQNYLMVGPGRTSSEYGISPQLPPPRPPFSPITEQPVEHTFYVGLATTNVDVTGKNGEVLVEANEFGQAALHKAFSLWRNVYRALVNWETGVISYSGEILEQDHARLRSSNSMGLFKNGIYVHLMEWYASEPLELPEDGQLITRQTRFNTIDNVPLINYAELDTYLTMQGITFPPASSSAADIARAQREKNEFILQCFTNKNYYKTYDITKMWQFERRAGDEALDFTDKDQLRPEGEQLLSDHIFAGFEVDDMVNREEIEAALYPMNQQNFQVLVHPLSIDISDDRIYLMSGTADDALINVYTHRGEYRNLEDIIIFHLDGMPGASVRVGNRMFICELDAINNEGILHVVDISDRENPPETSTRHTFPVSLGNHEFTGMATNGTDIYILDTIRPDAGIHPREIITIDVSAATLPTVLPVKPVRFAADGVTPLNVNQVLSIDPDDRLNNEAYTGLAYYRNSFLVSSAFVNRANPDNLHTVIKRFGTTPNASGLLDDDDFPDIEWKTPDPIAGLSIRGDYLYALSGEFPHTDRNVRRAYLIQGTANIENARARYSGFELTRYDFVTHAPSDGDIMFTDATTIVVNAKNETGGTDIANLDRISVGDTIRVANTTAGNNFSRQGRVASVNAVSGTYTFTIDNVANGPGALPTAASTSGTTFLATLANSETVTVQWDYPLDFASAGAIDGVVVRILTGSRSFKYINQPATSLTFERGDGIVPGQQHAFLIKAFKNVKGLTETSEGIRIVQTI